MLTAASGERVLGGKGAADDVGTQHRSETELEYPEEWGDSEDPWMWKEAPPMARLRLGAVPGAPLLHGREKDTRRTLHGRTWTQAVRGTPDGARKAAPREAELAEGWGVDGTGPTRATVIPVAQQRQARGSADADLHMGARQKLPTLCASRARVPLVSGDAVGVVRPMTAEEGARLMGIDVRSRAWRVAAETLSEEKLWRAGMDGVDVRMVKALWENAAEMAAEVGRTLRKGEPLAYGSMFGGAIDTILMGGQAEGWWARCLAIAESDEERRACAGEAYLVPERARFTSAWAMALRLESYSVKMWRLDVLSATPSCRLLSAARRVRGRGEASKAARTRLLERARERLLHDVEAVRVVAEVTCPTVIFFEETSGLRSHHKELYAELQAELRSWPYVWRHALVDAAALGAAHHRRRLLWVGVLRSPA